MKQSVKIVQGKDLAKQFRKAADHVPEKVDKLLLETAAYAHEQMVNHIKRNTKNGTGHLISSSYFEGGSGMSEVGNKADYAGFVEFGTGKRVQVPPEFSSIASAARSKSRDNFEAALQKIKDWGKRLGIKESAAYPILMSILRTGVMPRPFLFPAWMMGKRWMAIEANKRMKEWFKDVK